jgi:hypothetical protein
VAALVVLVLVHVAVVLSIVAQPLDMNARRDSYHSPVWPLFNDMVHRQGPAADFFAMYHAGVQAHRGQTPYGGAEQPSRTPYFFHYRYLPGAAQALGRPLALLQPRPAYWLWIGIVEAALAGLLAMLWRRAPTPWFKVAAAAALLLSAPFFLEVNMGQFTFITLALVTMSLMAIGDGPATGVVRTGAASVGIAMAFNLKVFPLVIGPALLRTRAGRVALALGVGALVALNLPIFVSDPEQWRAFRDLNFGLGSSGFGTGNFGFLYLVYMATGGLKGAWPLERWRLVTSVWQLLVLGSSASLALLSRHPARVRLGGCALIIAHLLSYAHVWEHHMSGAVPIGLLVLLCVAGASPQSARARRWSIGLALAAIALLALPTTFYLQDTAHDPWEWDPGDHWSIPARCVLPLVKAVPLLVLFGVALTALGQAGLSLPWRRGPRAIP